MLADPEKQWRTGYSARTIAYAWEAAKGHFPPEVERIFPEAGDEKVGNLEILLEFPEWKVYLPPAGHTSQNDLFVLANGEQGLVTIMVEGKVAEPFGETLESWLNSPTPGKLKLAFQGSIPNRSLLCLLEVRLRVPGATSSLHATGGS